MPSDSYTGSRLAGTLVFFVGLIGLIVDSLGVSEPAILNIHLLFGGMLSAAIAVCLFRQRHALGPNRNTEFYLYMRRVTRWVYILLYALAGVRLSLHMFELLTTVRNPHAYNAVAQVRPLDDFKIYLAYGLVPLWLIRFLVLIVPAKQFE